jgi:myosin heavy subunit
MEGSDGNWQEYVVIENTHAGLILQDKASGQTVYPDMSFSDLLPCNDTVASDMTSLQHMHEPAVLHNLEQRSLIGAAYTFMGTVLVSVNPFEWLPSQDKHTFIDQPLDSKCPHPYAIAGM